MHGAELDRSGGGDRPGGPRQRGGGHRERDVVVNLRAGFSDARFYRHSGVPSVVYGVGAYHMGRVDEFATVEDLNMVFPVYPLAVFDYLRDG